MFNIIQLLTVHAQPTEKPGLVNSFVCNCSDCRKITASMFASNFTVLDSHLKHLRGEENLKTWGQSQTIAAGNKMTNVCAKRFPIIAGRYL